MDQIYCEDDLVSNKELVWGQWKFAMSNEEIERKLSRLPELQVDRSSDMAPWSELFSSLCKRSETTNTDCVMEHSPIVCDPEVTVSNVLPNHTQIEDMASCLVDVCNQVAPKLRLGLSCVQEEMKRLQEDLCKVSDSVLPALMLNAWSQLNSDITKICFCIPFTENSQTCIVLCKDILLPWLSRSLPSKIELLSVVLAKEAETVSVHLVAPLLRVEDSPLAQDAMTLEELMTSMTQKHWTVLLKEFLSGLRELEKWQIPLLSSIVEHSKPSSDEVHLIVQLMSSTVMVYDQSRHYGSLLVAVAKCLSNNSGTLIAQIKLIVNNYKGPLKFKVQKILEKYND